MDHDEDVLKRVVREDNGGKEWEFYFNSKPPEPVKRDIEAALG